VEEPLRNGSAAAVEKFCFSPVLVTIGATGWLVLDEASRLLALIAPLIKLFFGEDKTPLFKRLPAAEAAADEDETKRYILKTG